MSINHHHEDGQADLDHLRKLGYETRDINLPTIRGFVIGFFAFATICVVICIPLYIWLVPAGWKPIPEPRRQFAMPSPMLQTREEAIADIKDLRASENAALTTYGMKDGKIRIPVEKAMELVAERGLPYGSSAQNINGANP